MSSATLRTLLSELGSDQSDRDLITRQIMEIFDAQRQAPMPDNTIRNMAATEAFRNARLDRDRRVAESQIVDDEAFVNDLRTTKSPLHEKVALYISSVARLAGQLQHDLIHPTLRVQWSNTNILLRSQLLKRKTSVDDLIDAGLSANAHIVCQNIASHFPDRLAGLRVQHMLNDEKEHDVTLIHLFSAATAARMRAHAVFNANLYKTKDQRAAVEQAMRESIRMFQNYRISGERVVHSRMPPAPQSLREHLSLASFYHDD